ncbi:MAG: hypothetical protein K0M49_03860 [Arenimonas sp.]|nr:hypothetical protein [Rhizobium sp.]MBW8444745.1 hypothetical protein [Arenimonas sp.]
MDSKAETPQTLGLYDVMRTIALEPDMAKVRLLADDHFRGVPSQQALAAATVLNFAHPFYLPAMNDVSAGRLSINLDQFSELVMRARSTARHWSSMSSRLTSVSKMLRTVTIGLIP